MDLSPEVYIPLLIVLSVLILACQLFATVWFVRWLFKADRGGWKRMAELYPVPTPLSGQSLTRQTLQVGMMRYKRMVTVFIGDQGLGLKRRKVLPWGPPPPEALIPWKDIIGWDEPRFIDWGYSLHLEKDLRLAVSRKTFQAMRLRLPNVAAGRT